MTQDHVAQEHRGHDRPDEIGVLDEDHRAGLQAIEDHPSQEDRLAVAPTGGCPGRTSGPSPRKPRRCSRTRGTATPSRTRCRNLPGAWRRLCHAVGQEGGVIVVRHRTSRVRSRRGCPGGSPSGKYQSPTSGEEVAELDLQRRDLHELLGGFEDLGDAEGPHDENDEIDAVQKLGDPVDEPVLPLDDVGPDGAEAEADRHAHE